MIVLVGGEKGGTGKSTLARNLAVFSAREGNRVCLVDADPQKTVTNWMSRRGEREPSFLVVELTTPKLPDGRQDPKGIAPRLSTLAKSYDPVIVDAGGRDSAELRSAMLVADIMVTPFAPSIDDVETVSKLITLITQAESVRGRALPVLAVTSLALPNPMVRGVSMMRDTFSDLDNYMTLSSNVIYRREAHSRLSDQGMCAADDRAVDYKAYTEMEFIYNEVFSKE